MAFIWLFGSIVRCSGTPTIHWLNAQLNHVNLHKSGTQRVTKALDALQSGCRCLVGFDKCVAWSLYQFLFPLSGPASCPVSVFNNRAEPTARWRVFSSAPGREAAKMARDRILEMNAVGF